MSELASGAPVGERPIACAVIGLGNPLMGDDGIGLAALARLQGEWRIPADVEMVDGGTWGMQLLPTIESCRRLLFLDAINVGGEPGRLVELEGAEIPRHFAVKLSPHQIDLRETLAVTALRGTTPPEMVAIGLQPGEIEMSTELGAATERGLGAMVEAAVRRLEAWGYPCARRTPAPGAAAHRGWRPAEAEPACTR